MRRIAIVSDIHYAGPREQAHGVDYEFAGASPSFGRSLARFYRHHIWMQNAFAHNGLVDRFIERAADADHIIANGDYTCDVAGMGVSQDDACESVQLCLGAMRARFGDRFHAIMGDHELGKVSLLGHRGGLRLQSWLRAVNECEIQPFWQIEIGGFVLLGITSTLVGLPVFRADGLETEWAEWETLRAAHLEKIREAFAALRPEQRMILFCHDPTALPFLGQEEAVRARFGQIDFTVVGHLHTRLVLWKSRLLAGFPPIRCCGVSLQRITTALNQARNWRPFNVRLCPALAGIELVKEGGFLTLDLDEAGAAPPRLAFHRIPR